MDQCNLMKMRKNEKGMLLMVRGLVVRLPEVSGPEVIDEDVIGMK